MVRLAPPGHGRIEFSKTLEVDVGGGEFNVAYACARLGLRGGFISKLPDNPVARIILNHARAVGLDVSNVLMEKFDGVGRKGRVGLNFTEVGTGVRASVTMYDRGHSAAMHMKPADADLDSLFEFAKAADVKVIYCLRLHNGDPQVDIQTVKYIMARYADEMDCFSIGQEPSAYPVEQKDTRPNSERMGGAAEKYQYSTYAVEWKKFADAIIAAVPGVKFCGPSVHNNGEWALKFMKDFGHSNNVVLITEHLYPGGAGGKVATPEIGRDRMLAGENSGMTNGFPRAYQKLYESFVPMTVSNGLPYRLEEVNNYFNGGATNVSNAFASALWGLDFMWWWAEHGAAGLNFHTGDKVAAGGTLQASKYTAYFTTTNGYLIRPLGYGIKAFDLGSHGQILPVKILSNADNANLGAYAVLGDDKNLCVTLINKEHGANAKDLSVAIGVPIPDYADARIIYLKAPQNDVAATSGVTLGGAEIKNDAGWDGKWEKMPVPAEKKAFPITVQLPAASACVVQFLPR